MSLKRLPAVLLVFSILCQAQTPTGTISGRVVDPSSAVIQGALITAINIDTNVRHATTTNAVGQFTIVNIPPGNYKLEISKPSFKTIVRPDIVVHIQDILALNFILPLGATSEIVTVAGGAPLVNTESGSVGTVIDRKFVSELPLNGRSFNTLLLLTPGVVPVPAGGLTPGQFSMSGQRANANYFSIDGVSGNFGVNATSGQAGAGGTPALNAYGGTSSLVSVDGLQEFRVQTSTVAPEYGRTPGGQVIIETRSGTNELHGGIFDYFRNDVLDANDWFANTLPAKPHAPERQNDFGGFIGGPILKNRTFFFLSYEGLRLRQPQAQVLKVPSLSARASAIPSAAPYLNAYPQPNGTDFGNGTAQFTGSFSNQAVLDATSIRVDHHFADGKWSLFGRYNYAPSKTQTGAFDSTIGPSNTTTTTIGVTDLLRPTISNSVRANYSIQQAGSDFRLNSLGGAAPVADNLLLPPPLSSAGAEAFFFLSGASTYIVGLGARNTERQINVLDNITFAAHSHQLKFGVDYRELRFRNRGKDAFYTLFASNTLGFASSGKVSSVSNSSKKPANILFHDLSIYGQDTWKVTPRLTITYGLRWELDPAPSGYDGTTLASWSNVDDPATTVLAPLGTPVWKTTYSNFAPRLGVACRLTENGDLVLRGGVGTFYDLGTSVVPELANAFPNVATLSVGPTQLPLASAAPFQPTFSNQPPYGTTLILGFSQNLKLPRSYQWNVALEKSLIQKAAVSVTYLGQVGRSLLRNELQGRPNANFSASSQIEFVRNADTSDYSALQVQFRQRVWHHTQVLLNYAWSHSIDSSSVDGSQQVVFRGALPGSSDRGSSDFDVRHSFSGAVAYDIPALTISPILEAITRGFSLDATIQAHAGTPIDVTYGGPLLPGFRRVLLRPDLIPGVPIWLQGSQCSAIFGLCPAGRGLNPAAFSKPSPVRQGSLGRNSITGVGVTQVDLSLARKFAFTERFGLQFRSDLFNVFNHPNFANPIASLDDQSFIASQMLNQGLGGLSPLYQAGGPRSVQLSLKLLF